MKKNFVICFVALICLALCGCSFDAESSTCVFDESNDKLIISNLGYDLEIYLYGNKLEQGEYEVFGSDGETVLEGTYIEDGVSVDVKTTLFINYSGESFTASGMIEFYKANSIKKSGETLSFVYNGKLLKR